MKRVFVVVLSLVVPAIAVWSCASPTDDPFGDSDDQDNAGGSGGTGGAGGAGGAPTTSSSGGGGTASDGGTTTSSTSSTSSSTTATSSSSGGGCDETTCLTQCFQQFLCGTCVAGACQCVPFEQCGFPGLDGGFDLDGGGFPDGFDLDGGFPDGI